MDDDEQRGLTRRESELEGKAQLEEFRVQSQRPYGKQAAFFLDTYWKEFKDKAEEIWGFAQRFEALDPKGHRGSSLEELSGHKFLETSNMTMTYLEMRDHLRRIDYNMDGRMSMLEFLVNWGNKTVADIIVKSENMTNATLEVAEELLAEVLDEILRIETLKADLREKAIGSGVKARAAFARLFEIENADPIVLNRMLIQAEAAVRKAKKAGGAGMGSIWWIERGLEEASLYKPKGGLRGVSIYEKRK